MLYFCVSRPEYREHKTLQNYKIILSVYMIFNKKNNCFFAMKNLSEKWTKSVCYRVMF